MSDPLRRPRVEGEREREIFAAATELLGEVGYDRLTLDAVAARVRVSKATIYRLWGDKSALVDAAIGDRESEAPTVPDTGSLSGDLRALATTPGFFDPERAAVISGLATAIHREPDRLGTVRGRLVDDGTKHVRALLERSVERGELTADVDIDLLSSVIPAMVLFQMTYKTEGGFGAGLVGDIVEKVLLPAIAVSTNETE
jgi:AcrR family transcriptional regulator